MSNYLAVDTSSSHLAVVAKKGENTVEKFYSDCNMRHSVILMDAIDEAMKRASLTPRECDFFCAVTGPGSFTGIRIGISTVKGLSLGAGKPAVGLTAFKTLAYNVFSDNFCIAIDAGRGAYYAEGFGQSAFSPQYLSAEKLEELNIPVYGFEELPLKNYHKLNAEKCLAAAIERAEKDKSFDSLAALYVRKSQAEEGRR